MTSAAPAPRSGPEVAGLLLAAGGGRRMGVPKALLAAPDGSPLLPRAVRALVDGGCGAVTVVLGAAADEAERALGHPPDPVDPDPVDPDPVDVVVAADWSEGMGASLRAGLRALQQAPARAVLVTLVDLPDVDARVVARVLDRWRADGSRADALVRATYSGRPGHPVLIGRDHWPALVAGLGGDVGAQPYLSGRRVREVSCEDLATGRDLDRPEDLARERR